MGLLISAAAAYLFLGFGRVLEHLNQPIINAPLWTNRRDWRMALFVGFTWFFYPSLVLPRQSGLWQFARASGQLGIITAFFWGSFAFIASLFSNSIIRIVLSSVLGVLVVRIAGSISLGILEVLISFIKMLLVFWHRGNFGPDPALKAEWDWMNAPLPRDEALEAEVAKLEAEIASIQGSRILVVDDDSDQAERVTAALKANRFEVTCAHDGVEGLALAREIIPDLILLNVAMPRMDGYTALKNLRADPKIKNIKVILTSAGKETIPLEDCPALSNLTMDEGATLDDIRSFLLRFGEPALLSDEAAILAKKTGADYFLSLSQPFDDSKLLDTVSEVLLSKDSSMG